MAPSSKKPDSSEPVLNQYALLQEQLKVQQDTNRLLQEVVYLLNGFTNNGSNLNGMVPDVSFLAYLSVVGPALARHLDEKIGIEEIKKGGVHLGASLIEEFSAYSSCQNPADKIYNSLEFLNTSGKD
jgi:hypothetical protein|tara:strand:- start:1003 stop:1383 length:381 start_codon:yes stop_codon:yes gene_type:complete